MKLATWEYNIGITFIFSCPTMKHLSITDRDQIQILLSKWYSHRAIAVVLWRYHKAIDDEIKNNSVKGKYIAKKAQLKQYQRRHSCKKALKKIRVNDELEAFVRKKLKEDRSPEEVSNYRNIEHEPRISYTTIYKYIYSIFGYGLTEHLYTKRLRPRKRRKKVKRVGIKYKTMIDFRPTYILEKRLFWHRECDLIVGKKWTKACLLVLIEMVTRKKLVCRIPNKWAEYVEQRLREYIKKYSIKSITFDNWTEFANHYKLWIHTYFCHPHSPREKPQVERWNRNIRRYYPKGTNFDLVKQKDIDLVVEKLNNRPMKCLNYQTPNNMFSKFLFQVASFTL